MKVMPSGSSFALTAGARGGPEARERHGLGCDEPVARICDPDAPPATGRRDGDLVERQRPPRLASHHERDPADPAEPELRDQVVDDASASRSRPNVVKRLRHRSRHMAHARDASSDPGLTWRPSRVDCWGPASERASAGRRRISGESPAWTLDRSAPSRLARDLLLLARLARRRTPVGSLDAAAEGGAMPRWTEGGERLGGRRAEVPTRHQRVLDRRVTASACAHRRQPSPRPASTTDHQRRPSWHGRAGRLLKAALSSRSLALPGLSRWPTST